MTLATTSASPALRAAASVSNTRGDVRVRALAGTIQVTHPGGRVEADTASGSVDIQGATNDVKAHAALAECPFKETLVPIVTGN